MSAMDQKGLRLAREVRAAMRRREEDADLQAAVEVYDRAVTPAERAAGAEYLLLHSTTADETYRRAVTLASLRAFAPELLPEKER